MAVHRVILAFLLCAFASLTFALECNIQNICFMIDQSGSIDSAEYQSEQKFIAAVAAELAVVNADLTFSAVAFATKASTIVTEPSDLSTLAGVVNGPRELPGGKTNMQLGMEGCVTELGKASGKSVIIMVTDGREDGGSVEPVADSVKASGSAIVTIGIGNKVSNQFLRKIASQPGFFVKTDFDSFYDDIQHVVESTCDAAAAVTPSPSPSPIPCNVQNVCFAIDQSGSIDDKEYFEETQFIDGVAHELDRVNDQVSFSATAFADDGSILVKHPSSLKDISNVLEGPRALTGETNMEAGMKGCVDMLAPVKGNRVIILVTDGRETDSISNVVPVADAAKADGVAIATVGIGNRASNKFLRGLATDASFYVKTEFEELADAIAKVTVSSCGAAGVGESVQSMISPHTVRKDWIVCPIA